MLTDVILPALLIVVPLFIVVYLVVRQLEKLTGSVEALLQRLPTAPHSAGSGTALAAPEVAGEQNALRLQACERLTLMLERINVPNLLLRLPPSAGMTDKEYTATLLLNIRQEFEYNVTQQIYVSDQLWSIMLAARDNVSQLIVRAAEGADSADQVASRLRLMSSRQPDDAIGVGQAAIRREASLVL